MKNFFVLLLFPALASAQLAKTDFWQARYEEKAELLLRPVTKGLAKDCARFRGLAGQKTSAADFADARHSPLAGQMLNTYSAVFEVSDGRSTAVSDPGTVVNAEVSVVPGSLNDVRVADSGPLTLMSARLGLAPAALVLRPVAGSSRPFIEVNARDLACDLIAREASLQATGTYQVALPAADILRLNKFYTRVEGITLSALSDSVLPWRRAVSLGYRLGQLFGRGKPSDPEMRENLEGLLRVLFRPGSFEPGDNWQSLGEDRFITYPKSVLAGPGPVRLKM